MTAGCQLLTAKSCVTCQLIDIVTAAPNSAVGRAPPRCVGELSPCKCSASNTSFDVIADNHYYSPTVNGSAPVCPAGSKIEAGSENAPMPTTEAVLGLARAALGMPAV